MSMKRLASVPACLVGFGLCLHLVQAGDQKELTALVDKAVKVMGGADKLAKLKIITCKSKGSLFVPNEIPITEEGWMQFPDKFRHDFELDINGVKIKQNLVIDGDKGWIKLTDKASPLTKAQKSAFRAYFYALRLATMPMELKDKGYKLSTVGEVKVGDRPAIGIQVMRKGFPDVNLFFDKEKSYPIKAEFTAIDYLSGQECVHEFLFKEYKEMDGLPVNTRMIWNKDGKKFADRELTDVKTVDSIDKGMFVEP
jgi:hypothetical protein